jgi:hypothetical protein
MIQVRDPSGNLLHGQRIADVAGGADQHLSGGNPQRCSGQPSHLARGVPAALVGGGVGHAAVGDDGAGGAVGGMLLGHVGGRGAEAVGGDGHGRGRRQVGAEQRQIELVGLDAAVDRGRAKAMRGGYGAGNFMERGVGHGVNLGLFC